MIQDSKTILIVDDTETNIDILLELLGNEYDILVALDGQSAIEIIEDDNQIDLILLDIMMPNMSGYEACKIFKTMDKAKNIPIIFITAKSDEDSIEEAYDAGGVDYISKPFKPRELLARIKTQIKLSELVKHLEFISFYDELTGIYNRRKFFSLSFKKFNEKKNIYALMIDIDKFKFINDTYGHAVGDKVIKAVAKSIAKNIEKETIFGRIGGEEFGILCDGETEAQVIQKVEQIRKEVAKTELLTEDNISIKCTISIGVAFASNAISNLDDLLKEADVALFEAKRSGRNRTVFK